MSEGLDIRQILPFLKHRTSEPVLLNFIICAEACGAILFIAFAFRVVFMVRHMYNSEIEAWRDQKMNELMDSISKLEKENKEQMKKEAMERSRKQNGDDIEEEGNDESVEKAEEAEDENGEDRKSDIQE